MGRQKRKFRLLERTLPFHVQGKFRNIGREDKEEEGVSIPEVGAAIGPS